MTEFLASIFIIAVPIVLVSLIQDSDDRAAQKRHDEMKQNHIKMLDLIGNKGNPFVIREQKARLETLLHSGLKEVNNIDYDPGDIAEVTTEDERRARRKAELEGRKYVHSWSREQIEEIIQDSIRQTGATREQLAEHMPRAAETMAKTYTEACDIDIEDARFAVEVFISALKSDAVTANPDQGVRYRSAEEAYHLNNGIKMVPVKSSAVSTIGYDADDEKLYVEFTSGSVYEYDDVPEKVYDAFLASRSKGRFVNDYLTYEYTYRRIGKSVLEHRKAVKTI